VRGGYETALRVVRAADPFDLAAAFFFGAAAGALAYGGLAASFATRDLRFFILGKRLVEKLIEIGCILWE